MNSSFPNRWSFSYLKFTTYVTNIIAEPKYKYGQQEQVTVRNHNRSIIAVISLPFKLVMVLAWFPITSSWNPACYIRGQSPSPRPLAGLQTRIVFASEGLGKSVSFLVTFLIGVSHLSLGLIIWSDKVRIIWPPSWKNRVFSIFVRSFSL